MINELLSRVVKEVGKLDDEEIQLEPSQKKPTQIPTLAPHVFRPLSPQLQERYTQFGAWPEATHADWLSLEQMEEFWNLNNAQSASRQHNLTVLSKNWPNDATALFKAERISVFALSEEGNERIYLIWFDGSTEPELWVYDTNGEAHYRDLKAYLTAYLDDDLTAYEHQWILDNAQN